jgi:hypothetical protein
MAYQQPNGAWRQVYFLKYPQICLWLEDLTLKCDLLVSPGSETLGPGPPQLALGGLRRLSPINLFSDIAGKTQRNPTPNTHSSEVARLPSGGREWGTAYSPLWGMNHYSQKAH